MMREGGRRGQKREKEGETNTTYSRNQQKVIG